MSWGGGTFPIDLKNTTITCISFDMSSDIEPYNVIQPGHEEKRFGLLNEKEIFLDAVFFF